jgi:hypothetical protein
MPYFLKPKPMKTLKSIANWLKFFFIDRGEPTKEQRERHQVYIDSALKG